MDEGNNKNIIYNDPHKLYWEVQVHNDFTVPYSLSSFY